MSTVYQPRDMPVWLCPNEPRCGHGSFLHDIEDYDDPIPRCCVDGCRCGAINGPLAAAADTTREAQP